MPINSYTPEQIAALLEKLAEQLRQEASIMSTAEQKKYAQDLAERTHQVGERVRAGQHSQSNGREFAVICRLIDDGIVVSPRREFNETYYEVAKIFKKWDIDYFVTNAGS